MRRWLGCGLVLAAVGAGVAAFMPGHHQVLQGPVSFAAAVTLPARPEAALTALPARQVLHKAGADLFAAPGGPSAAAAPPSPPRESRPAPSLPPNPYRLAGTARYGGSGKTFLELHDRLYEVRVGMILHGLYRVDSVTADAVTLVYLPLEIEERIALKPAGTLARR